MPSAARRRINSLTSRVPIGSSPEVGSSRISSSGCETSALANATRRAMPFENPPTARFAFAVRPTCSISSSVRVFAVLPSRPESPA